MFSYTVLIVVLYTGVKGANALPSTTCITSDTFESCQERGLYYVDHALFNGNCPGCIHLAGLTEDCSAVPCAPGLFCKEAKNGSLTCENDPDQACFVKRRAANLTGAWQPDCLPDGSFAPKQCKGEPMSGRCFCFSPDGTRIFGEEYWHNSQNMTCACSRMMWGELQNGREDASLHCNDQGNYEELQCDGGVCWCAHELTGEPFSLMVPDTMFKSLPCYDRSKYGDQYLRKCDSQRVSQYSAKRLLLLHGTDNIFFPAVTCNYDGSYARVQIVNNKKVCVSKDKMQITEWTTDLTDTDMTCNCEYDHYISDDPFNFMCLQNGNYAEKQYAGTQVFCVDEDGYNTPCPKTTTRKKYPY